MNLVTLLILAAIVALAFYLARPLKRTESDGKNDGGVFGGVGNLVPGPYDPGSGPPIEFEQAEHVQHVEIKSEKQ